MHGGDGGAVDRDDVDSEGGEPETGTAARYRRVLTLLPRAYREERGEEMLGVMLDAAQDAGRDRPTAAEMLSVLGLSLRLRTGAPGASARARSLGETLRLVTLLGLLLQVGFMAQSMASIVSVDGILLNGVGLTIIVVCGSLCPFLAMAALLNGRYRLGAFLAANPVVFATGVIDVLKSDLTRTVSLSQTLSMVALCAIPAIAGLFGFWRGTARVARPRLWFAALTVLGAVFLAADYGNDRPLGNAWALASNGLAVGCACLAVGFSLSRVRRSAVWPVALMVTGAPLLFMLPYTIRGLSFETGVPLTTVLGYPGSMNLFAGLYGLGAEVLLALTLLVALLRQSLGSPAGRQGHKLPHRQ